MSNLLFIQASPRGMQSKSIQIAETYLSALREQNPDLNIDFLSLRDVDLPAFDGDKAAAKINVMLGQEHTATQKTAWDQIVETASRFIASDRYLFAVPMWNSGIPYRLKHYIDVIHQPGLLWSLEPESGYFGLLENKHATLVLTAGAYAPSAPSPAFGVDHHSTYLHAWLSVTVGMTTNPIRAIRQSAKRERLMVPLTAKELRRLFAELGPRERTLVLLDVPTGMRRGEVLATQWCDIDFENKTLNIRRSIWQQHLGPVKTEESEKVMPLDDEMIIDLLRWRSETPYPGDQDWIFASGRMKGRQPLWPEAIERNHIRPAAERQRLPSTSAGTYSVTHFLHFLPRMMRT